AGLSILDIHPYSHLCRAAVVIDHQHGHGDRVLISLAWIRDPVIVTQHLARVGASGLPAVQGSIDTKMPP
ncbi:hypothetical protein, partial [Halomonas organivorans]|uniref:hypothetical protein n=1 Tax=Halomonas organivorans TaxID=257772 RepID=UPI001C85120B